MVRRKKMKAAPAAVGLLAAAFLWMFGTLPAAAQYINPHFEVDAVSARANDGSNESRLDVYTRVPYSSLQFITSGDGFEARYSIAIEVHELNDDAKAGNLVQTRMWEQAVSAPDFGKTQTDQLYDRTIQSLELTPGKYLLQFQIDDQNSSESFFEELAVNVRDLSGGLSVSDLILIESYDPSANSITPAVSHRIGSEQENFKLFYEIYSDRPQRVRVEREVVRVRKSSGPPSVKSLLGFGRNDDVENAEVSYQETAPRQLQTGRNQFVVEIPLQEFKVGEYVARVSVSDERGLLVDHAEKPLVLQWTGLADHVRDLDEAIAQLSYIAKSRDINYIKDGRTEQERLARFREFWKKRDPTQGTDRNERMEEYYYRVAYANQQYGTFDEGWRTDRGQIMVLFGEPDFVDRHPFNFDVKPYEVWFYYRIGRRFIFIDKTGLGDFELMVPYWDERTRIR